MTHHSGESCPGGYNYHVDQNFSGTECAFLDRWLESYIELDEDTRPPSRKSEHDIVAMLRGEKAPDTKGMQMYFKWQAGKERYDFLRLKSRSMATLDLTPHEKFLDKKLRSFSQITNRLSSLGRIIIFSIAEIGSS
jgi:uncharacterized protein YifE (UPF0438 family)